MEQANLSLLVYWSYCGIATLEKRSRRRAWAWREQEKAFCKSKHIWIVVTHINIMPLTALSVKIQLTKLLHSSPPPPFFITDLSNWFNISLPAFLKRKHGLSIILQVTEEHGDTVTGDALMHFRKGTWGQKHYLPYFIKINISGKISSGTSGWNSESQDYSWTTRPKAPHLPIPEVYLIRMRSIYHHQNNKFESHSKFSQKGGIK